MDAAEEQDRRRLVEENWGSLMEFLGDDRAHDYKRSMPITTDGVALKIGHKAHQNNRALGTLTRGLGSPAKDQDDKSGHAMKKKETMAKAIDRSKLQSLVNFSKKVGLNQAVIQTVQLIEQSGQINTPGYIRTRKRHGEQAVPPRAATKSALANYEYKSVFPEVKSQLRMSKNGTHLSESGYKSTYQTKASRSIMVHNRKAPHYFQTQS